MEKDLTKLPNVKGMIRQIEAYWEKQNEIEMMLKNQADIEKDDEVRLFMSKIYAGFCWENMRRASFHMGYNLFPEQLIEAHRAESAVVGVMREQRQKQREEAVMESSDEPKAS